MAYIPIQRYRQHEIKPHTFLTSLQATQVGNVETKRGTPELEVLEGVGEVFRRGRYRVHRLRDPGKQLDKESLEALIEMIIRESSTSFGGDMRSYWTSRPHYFNELTEWWVADYDGEVAGWHGFSVWDGPCGTIMYFDSLNVMPGHRRTGIGSLLTVEPWLRICLQERCCVVVTLRTESPVVFRMFKRLVGRRTFPNIDGGAKTGNLRALRSASFTIDRINPGCRVEPNTFVVRNALSFAGDIYGAAIPDSGIPALDVFFREHLEQGSGDVILAVGTPTIWRFTWAVSAFVALRKRLAMGSRSHGIQR